MNADIMITGASGYVGSRLYFDLSKSFRTIGTYNSRQLSEEFEKLDITNSAKVRELVRKYRPETIIHAAANASSKSCKDDPINAVMVNRKGTQNIVDAANEIGSVVMFISATVAELQKSLYEETKFAGEITVKGAEAGYVILRPSVVFGMSPNTETDKPFNQMLRNIRGEGSPNYDTSWRFQPTWVTHMSEVIMAIMHNKINSRATNTDMVIPVTVDEMRSKFDIANDVLPSFGVAPKQIDQKSWRPSTSYSGELLRKFDLPVCTYREMVSGMIREIKERDRYVL